MPKNAQDKLVRTLGLGAIIIYGVGDILGAGIYALVGKVAQQSGQYAWLSFAVAMAIVFLTALNYSELTSRFPQSGGVSIFIQHAFKERWFSIFVGFLLLSATILSMATLSQAFVGYLRALGVFLPNWLGIFIFLLILLGINIRGIRESSIANIVSTLIEVSGLIIVLVCGYYYLNQHEQNSYSAIKSVSYKEILQGAALAFFAFTGFEDLANISEEVREPRKNLPKSILSALGMAGILYLSVTFVATSVVDPIQLGQSDSPLLDVIHKAFPKFPLLLFSFIALFAVSNTTLLNYVTASRLLYGMAESRLLPGMLKKVHPRYHTPYISILLIFPVVFTLALSGTIKDLASSTSAIVLIVFSFSALALLRIKWGDLKSPSIRKPNHFTIPFLIPCLAIFFNLVAITFLPIDNILPAGILIFAGIILLGIFRLVYTVYRN